MLRIFSILYLIVLLCLTAEGVHLSQNAKRETPATTDNSSKSLTESEQRLNGVMRVRALSEYALEFQDIKERIRTVMGLADLLWKYDEPYTRQLVLKAFDSIKASASSITKAEKGSTKSRLTAREVVQLRQEIIVRIARRDIDLARHLTDIGFDKGQNLGDERDYQSQTYLLTAINLADENPVDAVKFAEGSLRNGMSQTTLSFLQKLRRKNETIADEFFLRILSALRSQQSVDANELLLAGNYAFSVYSNQEDGQKQDVNPVVWAVVNNLTIINIFEGKLITSPDNARVYLDTAVAILSRPIINPKQKQLYYIAAYQLLPYTKVFAPNRVPELEAAMRFLISDVPSSLIQSDAYVNLGPISNVKAPEEMVHDIDKLPDEQKRDELRLGLTHSACLRGDFTIARNLAQSINNLLLKNQLNDLISFSEGIKLLEKGDLILAEEKAKKLGPSVEKAVLWLGLGHQYTEEGDIARAMEALNEALRCARATDDAQRPILILAIAGQFAGFDIVMARQTLAEAVNSFNATEKTQSVVNTLSQTVSAGRIQVKFPLKFKNVDYGFAPVLRPLVEADPEGTFLLVLSIKNEVISGQALIPLGAAILK